MRSLKFDSRKMLRCTLPRQVAVLALLSLSACTHQTLENGAATVQVTGQQESASAAVDILVSLDRHFRQAYDDAVEHHRDNVVFDAPVITQDLLNMTLIRANGERIRFEMDKITYFIMARASHPVIGVFSIISMSEGDSLSAEQLSRLTEYHRSIVNAIAHVDDLPVDTQARTRINTILSSTAEYVAEITASGIATVEGFERYVEPLRPLIQENFRVGASEQLVQFKAQMDLWKAEYPNDNWNDLRVVILGFHQPRDLYALTQFFKWLVSEEETGPRVVYAEFQRSIFGENSEIAQRLAVELATKVDLDRIVSAALFEDETYLESDLLGRAAREIIATWGESDFRVE